ncbi:MAG: peptide-binding protein [Nitrospirae bacterium]|nr:peptide-binding protein [Nitrospirota bacterium]
MLKERSRPLFIFALFFFAANISCNHTLPSNEQTTGDALIIPEYQKPAFVNPLLTETTLSARLSEIIFDGLIQVDERFEPKPHLAESWERSKDGRTWTFHLRPGVGFHDGMELTAEDVAFTFGKMQELQNGIPFGFIFQDVDTITVEDKYTVRVKFKNPMASLIQALVVGILPKHLLGGEDIKKTSFNQHPIGTGPYKLKSWSEKEIILEANNDYFLGRPHLDQIQVRVYPNREAAWAKLMAGEVDFFDLLTPDNYEILKQVPTFHLYSVPMPYYYLVAFNLKQKLFSDLRVRQALNYAINKEEIVAKVLRGQGQVAAETIYPGSWAYSPGVKPYSYDPKRALTLFKEAGWADHDGDHFLDKNGKPFEFTVNVNEGDDLKQKALFFIQQQLLDIGIRMKVMLFDATDTGFLFKKKFDAHFPEIVARGDPDFSYKYWHSSQIKDGFNVSSYRNGKVDRLLEEGRTEFDMEKRKALYFSFQEEILKDPPGIFLFWTNYLVGVHERFKGVQISPVGPFANIREWYVPKAEQKYTDTKFGDPITLEKDE